MNITTNRTLRAGCAAIAALCIALLILTSVTAGDKKTSAVATTTTITGTAGGDNSWNTAENWDNGVPTGTVDVVIAENVTAKVNTDTTPNYSGTLTLNTNSKLYHYGAGKSTMTDATSITLNSGATLQYALNGITAMPAITLAGDATIDAIIPFSDHDTTDLAAVTGDFVLTLKGFNNHKFNLNAANSFSGLIAQSHAGNHIHAKAAGAFGKGDVTVLPDVADASAELHLEVADTIHDNAKLTMNGNGNDESNEVRINVAAGVNEVIRALVIDEVEMDPGVYDNTYEWFAGEGTLTVTGNYVPEAHDQAVTVDMNTPSVITLEGTDGDGDELTYTIVTQPTNGTLSGDAPDVTYTPNADYVGSDSFTFKVNDGTIDSNTATVNITVVDENGDNTAPVADDQNLSVDQNDTLAITLTATDDDGDELTYSIVSQPDHGTLTGTPPALTYTPDESYTGPDSFTFKANDGTVDSNVATIYINVTSEEANDPPVADDQAVTVKKDVATGITLTATDPESDPLTYTVVTQPSHGTLSGTAPDLTYTPDAGYTGSDSFTFKANDGEYDSNTATVSITVKESVKIVIPYNYQFGRSGGVLSGEEGCNMGRSGRHPMSWYLPSLIALAIVSILRWKWRSDQSRG